MKARSFIALSLLAILSLIGLWIAKIFTTNPPIKIVGGSIRITFDNTWKQDYPKTEYEGQVLHPTSIHTKNLYDNAGLAVSKPIIAQNGFVINLYDAEPDGITPREHPGAQLCTDPACSGSLGNGTTVYLRIYPDREDDAQLEGLFPKDVHFHSIYKDPKAKCDKAASGDDEAAPCNHLTEVGIVLDGIPEHEMRYVCDKAGKQPQKCSIGINDDP